MKFAIMGSGGIGGYFGGRLAAAGIDTQFIARGAHLEAMLAQGLKIESPLGDAHITPVRATDDPGSIGPVDCILVATKLWNLAEAATACRPLIGPDTAALSLQNGVNAEEDLSEILGASHVLGGVAEITSFIAQPGVVKHGGNFARIRFGELDGRRTPRAENILQALTEAGIETELSDNIKRLLWLKFIFIIGTTNLTSLTRQTMGPIRNDPRTRALIAKSFEEVIAIARAKGIDLDDDVADERMKFFDKLPDGMTTSLANDLENGSRLELDWLAGNVARMGKALNIPTPFNDLVYDLLKLNNQGRGRS